MRKTDMIMNRLREEKLKKEDLIVEGEDVWRMFGRTLPGDDAKKFGYAELSVADLNKIAPTLMKEIESNVRNFRGNKYKLLTVVKSQNNYKLIFSDSTGSELWDLLRFDMEIIIINDDFADKTKFSNYLKRAKWTKLKWTTGMTDDKR